MFYCFLFIFVSYIGRKIFMIRLKDVYTKFPDKRNCIMFLETIRWNNKPVCPYCKSNRYSILNKEFRYHCNECNTSYSVTVDSVFHRTKIDFQKWFFAMYLFINSNEGVSVRELAEEINVTKDTSWLLLNRLRQSFLKEDNFTKSLADNIQSIENANN